MNYKLISDYMHEDKYRISFNKLAMDTFGLDFEDWYQKELFFNRYLCYSYIHKDKVISNVSVNKIDLLVGEEKKRAIQIGTVMTHPDYRNQGLSAALMKHVIEKYEKEYDIIYLFANKEVLEFYPRFGFKKVIEGSYELKKEELNEKQCTIRKLNSDNPKDYEIILKLSRNRLPISRKLGVCNDIWPLFVYCLYEFKKDLYYLEEENAIVVARREDEILHLYDVISLKPVDLDNIIEKFVKHNDTKIEFHFIPEFKKYKVEGKLKERPDDTLFVKTKNTELKEVLFPITSHT